MIGMAAGQPASTKHHRSRGEGRQYVARHNPNDASTSRQRQELDDGSTTSKLASVYPDTCYIPHQNRQITRAQAIVEERSKPIPALHQAILNGRFGEALMLINQGADARQVGPFGWTPLHTVSLAYARYEFYGAGRLMMLEAIASALLTAGAAVHVNDYFGLTPAMCAEGKAPRATREATSQFIRAAVKSEGDPGEQ